MSSHVRDCMPQMMRQVQRAQRSAHNLMPPPAGSLLPTDMGQLLRLSHPVLTWLTDFTMCVPAGLQQEWPRTSHILQHDVDSHGQDCKSAQPTKDRRPPFLPCTLQDPRKRADANRVLQHEWMRENGTASERPLDNVILKRMRGFAAMNKLKKEALKVIAAGMTSEEIAGLRSMFQVGRRLLISLLSP